MRRSALASLCTSALALATACGWSELDAVAPPPAADASGADARPPDGSPDDAPAPSAACLASGEPVLEWTFDSDLDGWFTRNDPGVSASASWSGAQGRPSPGAVEFQAMPGDGSNQGAWLTTDLSADLAQHAISAWVWLDAGASPRFKLYVQTGSQFAWADGGIVDLPLRQWACVSLNLTAPSYEGPGYDPTQVVAIGFETMAIQPFRLFVDGVIID